MIGQMGFFDIGDRLAELSKKGDPLERIGRTVDFELCRGDLEGAVPRSDRTKGGRPPYDHVVMFKVLVLQTLYTLSDEQTEFQITDRLSFSGSWVWAWVIGFRMLTRSGGFARP